MEQNKVTHTDLRDRAIGCLFGQAIGDALGTLCEFEDAPRAKLFVDQEIAQFGHLSLKNKNITDDTEMALALARSLIRKGRYDPIDVAQSYVTWFHSGSNDIGRATHNAFDHTQIGLDNYATIIRSSQKLNINRLSNGCLMRISPLGIYGINISQPELEKICRLDTVLTNPNQMTQEAVISYVTAITTAIKTGNLSQVIRKALEVTPKDSLIYRTIGEAINLEGHHQIPLINEGHLTYTVNDSVYQGYVGIALFEAFYEVTHSKDFHHIMKRIMSRGGDTDTNCAITGALYGALHGYRAIPVEYLNAIMSGPYLRHQAYPWGQTHDLPEVALRLIVGNQPV